VFARCRPYDTRVTLVHADPGGAIVATATCATKSVLVAGTALLYAHIMDGNAPSLGTFRAAGYRPARMLVSRTYPLLRAVGQPLPEARPLDDWDGAARLLGASLGGYDLVRPLDGSSLRMLWSALPGWRPDDVWSTDRALLGLWDYSPVARGVPMRLSRQLRILSALATSASGILLVPRLPSLGKPIRYGLLLGAAGDPEDLAALFVATLTRARERQLDILVFLHDATLRLAWTKRAFSVAGAYHLVAKSLVTGPADRLGARPVWVDPVDL
jgi:hypothetical protein